MFLRAAMLLSLIAAPAGAGWKAAESSLLLSDRKGELYNEIGLGVWREELGDGLYLRRRMLGGVSANGRFAWHFQKLDTIRSGRVDQVISSTRTLVYLGTSGQVLWTNALADSHQAMPPLLQSDDGETALVLERGEDGWTAAAYAFTGNRLMEIKASNRLEEARLTKNGRFVMVRWSARDLPLYYSFLDLKKRARHDIPASDLPLGMARITEKGVVRSGRKRVYRFP
ncbi:MAG: hypothetical protein V3S11_03580 [Elusimicrobiota bacterium]